MYLRINEIQWYTSSGDYTILEYIPLPFRQNFGLEFSSVAAAFPNVDLEEAEVSPQRPKGRMKTVSRWWIWVQLGFLLPRTAAAGRAPSVAALGSGEREEFAAVNIPAAFGRQGSQWAWPSGNGAGPLSTFCPSCVFPLPLRRSRPCSQRVRRWSAEEPTRPQAPTQRSIYRTF